MLTLDTDLDSHLKGRVTSLTVCWVVTRKDGEVLRGTAHDRDITIDSGTFAGTYPARATIYSTDIASKSDGSVSNADVDGALFSNVDELTVADIEGGLFDQARAVLFMVNWADPNAGQKILLSGRLGEFYRDSDGRYRSEVRSLTQALSQNIGETYSERCAVKLFGDARCGFNVAAVTRTGTVTEVLSRKVFTVSLDAGAAPIGPASTYYAGGRLTFTSGGMTGVIREARMGVFDDSAETEMTILLWDEAPADVEVGVAISLEPGCDRAYDTCKLIHQNLVNFRGHGVFAVGRDALMRGINGTTTPIVFKTLEEWLEEKAAQDVQNRALLDEIVNG